MWLSFTLLALLHCYEMSVIVKSVMNVKTKVDEGIKTKSADGRTKR